MTATTTTLVPGSSNGSDPTTAAVGETPAAPQVGPLEIAFAVVLTVLLLVVGVLGAVVSYAAVRVEMVPSFGKLAWTVPVGVDVGIALFTAWDLFLARMGMRFRAVRYIPRALIAATIFLNVEPSLAKGDLRGAVGHAVLPAIWIVSVEMAAAIVRRLAGISKESEGVGRLDRIRPSRWLLAPVSTLRILRWMILHEERSYDRGRERWWGRQEAKWALQDLYGPLWWRVRAPRQLRGRYRRGELTAAQVAAHVRAGGAAAMAPPVRGAGSPDGGKPPRRPQGPASTRSRPGPARPQPDRAGDPAGDSARRRVDDHELAELLGDLEDVYGARGDRLTARAAASELHERGCSAGNDRITKTLAALRTGTRPAERRVEQ